MSLDDHHVIMLLHIKFQLKSANGSGGDVKNLMAYGRTEGKRWTRKKKYELRAMDDGQQLTFAQL